MKVFYIFTLSLLTHLVGAKNPQAPAANHQSTYMKSCAEHLNKAYSLALRDEACLTPPVPTDINCKTDDGVNTIAAELDAEDIPLYCRALANVKPGKGELLTLKSAATIRMINRVDAISVLGKTVDHLDKKFIPQDTLRALKIPVPIG